MKNEIINELEKRLKEEFSKKENEHKHITYLREKVLKEAKEEGIIKDYKATTNYDHKKLYFGSCSGYDKMFLVVL